VPEKATPGIEIGSRERALEPRVEFCSQKGGKGDEAPLMSRKHELLKLAKLFHLQAKLAKSRAAKQALRRIGDEYQHEAERLQGPELSKEPVASRPSGGVGRMPKSEEAKTRRHAIASVW
jgi:hypothetical protein